MHAVILDRNKQYSVMEGSIIRIDNVDLNAGDKLFFNDILIFDDGNTVVFGSPYLKNIRVVSEVLKNFKDDKVVTLKFRRRKHYMNKCGHRQNYTLVKIVSILND
ncbi:MAG TPA: 50S ribosomal protein L21 [Candidatus Azoamicus sp. OHIO1]